MKKIAQYIFVFLLAFMVSCSEDLVDEVTTGTIKGTVVKKGSNTPIANVKITTSPTTNTVFTGSDGSFTIDKAPVGDYSVKAESSGYVANYQGINLKNGGQSVSVVFEMSDDTSLNSPP